MRGAKGSDELGRPNIRSASSLRSGFYFEQRRQAKRVAEEELLMQRRRFAPRHSLSRRPIIRSASSLRSSRPTSYYQLQHPY